MDTKSSGCVRYFIHCELSMFLMFQLAMDATAMCSRHGGSHCIGCFFVRQLLTSFIFCSFCVSRYSRDEEALDDQEETGWKYIHGDVFRYPPFKSLFCAVLGTGTQLLAL